MELALPSLSELAIAFLVIGLGGIVKGATGAGAPILAIPALTVLFDIKLAVMLMLMPNMLTNIWQAWHFRHARLPWLFTGLFAFAGMVGAGFGSWALATLPQDTLTTVVAVGVIGYIGMRLGRPDWVLPYWLALRLCLPAGLVAGLLQGASGVSAPVSISFLNAMKLERGQFIAVISVFFFAMTLVQVPALAAFGLFTPTLFVFSLATMVPILAFMPVGACLARHLSRAAFEKVILALLAALAAKLLVDSLL